MLRVMSYNIRFGGAGREERIAAVIGRSEADLVILQEATDPKVVERLAELTKFPHWAAKRKHSVAYLSRTLVRSHVWHYHPKLERAILEIELDGVRVFG